MAWLVKLRNLCRLPLAFENWGSVASCIAIDRLTRLVGSRRHRLYVVELRNTSLRLLVRGGAGSHDIGDVFEVWDRRVYTPDWLWTRLRSHLDPSRQDITIVDVGASIGDFSLFATEHLPRSSAYAYEASPETFGLLQANIAINQASERVRPVRKAIGAADGKANSDARQAPMISLGEVIDELGRIHLLKMDIEGMEFAAFREVTDDQLGRVDCLTMELHTSKGSAEYSQFCERLVRAGFHVRSFFPDPGAGCGYLYALRRNITEELMAEMQ